MNYFPSFIAGHPICYNPSYLFMLGQLWCSPTHTLIDVDLIALPNMCTKRSSYSRPNHLKRLSFIVSTIGGTITSPAFVHQELSFQLCHSSILTFIFWRHSSCYHVLSQWRNIHICTIAWVQQLFYKIFFLTCLAFVNHIRLQMHSFKLTSFD